MFLKTLVRLTAAISVAWTLHLPAQISISGVTDKTAYANTATFTITGQAGYTYTALLNTNPVPVGSAVTVTRPDFYQLWVRATNDGTSATTETLVRFLVHASSRNNSEWGLPLQVPLPVIQSASEEFSGASLRVIAPQDFPAGHEIPVVVWALDADGHAVRANGLVAASGHSSFQLRRGVGSGFLSSSNPPGSLNYSPGVGGLTTNKVINLEATTSWASTAGTLNGSTTWPDGARIRVTSHLNLPAGATLTVGAGAIVLLNPGVNITNNGSIVINGTIERPVVFMPQSRSQPWGGFFMRTSSGSIDATGTIFTGSGADPNGGAGHRSEQCLFLCDNSPRVTLTDSAAIYLAGQLGHAYRGGAFNFTRFLMQRAVTGGEYTGANFTVSDSAFIECPDDTANFVDGDNDGLYLVTGTHSFTNTLFGWTKDDGIDSGGDGAARLHYEQCWFEATFHEGNSLSGLKNTSAHRTVYLDCGQGLEDGYGAGGGGPTGRVDRCVFAVCKSGVRHGDNYPGIGNGYPGILSATNSLFLHNYRDVFGYNWRSTGWTNAGGQMFIRGNFLTKPDTNFPDNAIWNPSTDAWRLAEFGARGRVGLGFATRPAEVSIDSFPDGLPVGLSSFCTNEVVVDYSLEATDGTSQNDTLRFAPGELRKFIPLPSFSGVLRVALANPQNADFTGASELFFQILPSNNATLVAKRSVWKYLDDGVNQFTAWREPGFDDSTWPSGPGSFGFGDGPEGTTLRPTTSPPNPLTYYFRTQFSLADTSNIGSLLFNIRRDDGVVAFLNGFEVFRMNMPSTNPINYGTFASSSVADEVSYFPTNVSAARLIAGTNVLAVELHQQSSTSGDAHFDLEMIAQPSSSGARVNFTSLGGQLVLYWSDPAFSLEQAPEIIGGWSPAAATSPAPADTTAPRRFYRLKKP